MNFLIEDLNYKEGECFLFTGVLANNNGDTPLDLAIKDQSVKSIESILDMLAYRPNYNFSKYLNKHIYTLMEMRSASFERFLETCSFRINKPFRCEWPFSKDFR